MPGFERSEFEDAMLRARKATDPRSDFDVYFDVARRLVKREIQEALKKLPLTDEHKAQLIEAEAYSKAQPAHLSDTSTYQPTYLLEMLEQLSVFGNSQSTSE